MSHLAELHGLYTRMAAIGETVVDNSKVAKLLTSLPSEYDGVCDALRTIPRKERTWADVQGCIQDDNERKAAVKKKKGESDDTGRPCTRKSSDATSCAGDGRKRDTLSDTGGRIQ